MADAVGAVVGVGASLFGMSQQKKAMKEQEKAMKEQRRLQVAADQRERRQLLRQTAIARGQTVNVAAQIGGGQGATAGTGLIGGLSGLQGQVLSSLGFQGTSQQSVNKQQKFLDRATQYQTNAMLAQGIGELGAGLMQTNFGSNLASGIGARFSSTFAQSMNPMQSLGSGLRYTNV